MPPFGVGFYLNNAYPTDMHFRDYRNPPIFSSLVTIGYILPEQVSFFRTQTRRGLGNSGITTLLTMLPLHQANKKMESP
jgi:hypothetical protein